MRNLPRDESAPNGSQDHRRLVDNPDYAKGPYPTPTEMFSRIGATLLAILLVALVANLLLNALSS